MPTWLRFAILILAVAGVYFAADWLIVSDEEKIDAALDGTLARLVARDAAGALSIVDEGFDQEGIRKPDLLSATERVLARDPPRSLENVRRRIRVENGRAEVRARVRYLPAPQARMPYSFDTDWTLGLEKRGKDWRVVRIELADLAGQSRQPLSHIVRAVE